MIHSDGSEGSPQKQANLYSYKEFFKWNQPHLLLSPMKILLGVSRNLANSFILTPAAASAAASTTTVVAAAPKATKDKDKARGAAWTATANLGILRSFNENGDDWKKHLSKMVILAKSLIPSKIRYRS